MTEVANKRISPAHAIFGGWRMLGEDDVIQPGDESGCLSTLLSIECHEGWMPVSGEHFPLGKTVAESLADDIDCHDRVFRRMP